MSKIPQNDITTTNKNTGKQVMPELAFELEEIFRTRLFSFPLDDHESAREVFRYLLDRGVPEDELAHVIQASTNSMTLWLCRTGLKKMVGEWIISWMNKCYNQYLLKETSGRGRIKSARDCQPCSKESDCLPTSEGDGKSRGRGGGGGGGGGGRGRSSNLSHHSRSFSRPEIANNPDDDDGSILPFKFNLDKSSEKMKSSCKDVNHLHLPNLHLHLMCKNFVSFLRRGSDIVISLSKVQTQTTLAEISRPQVLDPSLRSSYSVHDSLPSDKKWKHLKEEFSKFRSEKRDSGIVEDIEFCLPQHQALISDVKVTS